MLTTVDGQKLSDVKSGHDGPGAGRPQLKFPWSHTYTAVDHADGHAAAIMRTRRIRNATLYLNNPPCEGLAGCDTLLPAQLRRGDKLTVYGPNGFVKVYRGTGEGVA